jgi:hypothetical protein
VAATDVFLPQSDETAFADVLVSADSARTYAAIGSTDVTKLKLWGVLGGLEGARERFAAGPAEPRTLDRLLGAGVGPVELFADPYFRRVIGIAGRYHFDRQVVKLSPEEFAAFDEPGSVKAVAEFTLTPEGDATRLWCDLRVRATDEDTRSTLRTTWIFAGPALRFVLPRFLDAVRAQAEGSGSQGAEQGDADGDHGDAGDLHPG